MNDEAGQVSSEPVHWLAYLHHVGPCRLGGATSDGRWNQIQRGMLSVSLNLRRREEGRRRGRARGGEKDELREKEEN